jgi:transposase
LDRTRPVLPLRPGVPERQTHDYIRHGTTCLYAALRVLDGVVLGECRPKRDTKAFVRFLTHVEQATAPAQAIHVILDNLSTHKSPPVQRWLRRHRRVHFHFIPASSSWLNLVERWFGEITRDRIRRGTFEGASADTGNASRTVDWWRKLKSSIVLRNGNRARPTRRSNWVCCRCVISSETSNPGKSR